jgi:hypothetical protein
VLSGASATGSHHALPITQIAQVAASNGNVHDFSVADDGNFICGFGGIAGCNPDRHDGDGSSAGWQRPAPRHRRSQRSRAARSPTASWGCRTATFRSSGFCDARGAMRRCPRNRYPSQTSRRARCQCGVLVDPIGAPDRITTSTGASYAADPNPIAIGSPLYSASSSREPRRGRGCLSRVRAWLDCQSRINQFY